MKRAANEDRMIISNGVVEVRNGEITGVDFRNCHIDLGPKVTLTDCIIDGQCKVTTNG